MPSPDERVQLRTVMLYECSALPTDQSDLMPSASSPPPDTVTPSTSTYNKNTNMVKHSFARSFESRRAHVPAAHDVEPVARRVNAHVADGQVLNVRGQYREPAAVARGEALQRHPGARAQRDQPAAAAHLRGSARLELAAVEHAAMLTLLTLSPTMNESYQWLWP